MAPKDRIQVTIERRRVWAVTIDGEVQGRPVWGSATAPDLRMVGAIIGGVQRLHPAILVKVHWASPRPKRPKKGGRR